MRNKDLYESWGKSRKSWQRRPKQGSKACQQDWLVPFLAWIRILTWSSRLLPSLFLLWTCVLWGVSRTDWVGIRMSWSSWWLRIRRPFDLRSSTLSLQAFPSSITSRSNLWWTFSDLVDLVWVCLAQLEGPWSPLCQSSHYSQVQWLALCWWETLTWQIS